MSESGTIFIERKIPEALHDRDRNLDKGLPETYPDDIIGGGGGGGGGGIPPPPIAFIPIMGGGGGGGIPLVW